MHPHRFGARAEHRRKQSQRVRESATLAQRFPKLKSLRVEFETCDPDGTSKGSPLKYEVNIQNAKAVFRFNCPNPECVRGDFDLSDVLARAVRARRKLVKGEMTCHGWRSKDTIGSIRCDNILRYRLQLSY